MAGTDTPNARAPGLAAAVGAAEESSCSSPATAPHTLLGGPSRLATVVKETGPSLSAPRKQTPTQTTLRVNQQAGHYVQTAGLRCVWGGSAPSRCCRSAPFTPRDIVASCAPKASTPYLLNPTNHPCTQHGPSTPLEAIPTPQRWGRALAAGGLWMGLPNTTQ